MGVGPAERSGAGRGWLWLGLAAVVLAGIAVGLLYLSKPLEFKAPAIPAAPSAGELQRCAVGGMKKLQVAPRPTRLTDLAFNDAAGRPADLSRFTGKVVVVNVWATWCVPCTTEMPTLATLQRAYPDQVAVVPVSVDVEERLANARDFIGVNEPLQLYHDPNFALQRVLKIPGMPGTVIYGRDGREIARVVGEADWAGPEARALFDALLK
ncbi:MAG: TlpA family protein disulfide reductase [Caulobacteraceae bacterium]|nr:TlpA family protein disulfide reductase [Caulobacteraceae bacterium]